MTSIVRPCIKKGKQANKQKLQKFLCGEHLQFLPTKSFRSLAKSFHFNLRNKQMLALFSPSENYHNKWILLNKALRHRKFCNKIISHLPMKLPEKQKCREYSFLVGSGWSAPRPRSVWKHWFCSLLSPTLSNSYLLATAAANGDNQTLLESDEAPPVLRSK